MSFIKHGGVGKTFPINSASPTLLIWSEYKLRSELISRGVWPTSLPGNVENWHPQVLADVRTGTYTFEQFADEFANHQPFDFGETLKRLREPVTNYGGGWYNRYLTD